MRPVHRGDPPQADDFENYRDAFGPLVARLGQFCSFCERRIPTNLDVEHIQPKEPDLYPHLAGRWTNYLLACRNCNATKGHKDVHLENLYLPDRDNTLVAFSYQPDGSVHPRRVDDKVALESLMLTGLEKTVRRYFDENGKLVALDRITQRMEIWSMAERSRSRLSNKPIPELVDTIIELALSTGFFSVWMHVFESLPDIRKRFIDSFPGTASDCFDQFTQPVSPRPNNGLEGASKI